MKTTILFVFALILGSHGGPLGDIGSGSGPNDLEVDYLQGKTEAFIDQSAEQNVIEKKENNLEGNEIHLKIKNWPI
jgi:hypothetical protein